MLLKDRPQVIEIPLVPLPRTIVITNLPERCEVSFNGKASPVAHGVVRFGNAVIGTRYNLEISSSAFHLFSTQVVALSLRSDLVLDGIPLRRKSGTLNVKLLRSGWTLGSDVDFKKAAQITLDSQSVAQWEKMVVPTGVHLVRAVHPDYDEREKSVTVEDGGESTVEIALTPKTSTLSLNVLPDKIDFSLIDADGRVFFVTNGNVFLNPGRYSLKIRAPNYLTATREFFVEANRSYTWETNLVREGIPEFEKAKQSFNSILTDENLALLASYGGKQWTDLQAQTEEAEALKDDPRRGSVLYDRAKPALMALLADAKRARDVAMERREFQERIEKLLDKGNVNVAVVSVLSYRNKYGEDDNYRVLNAKVVTEIQRQADTEIGQRITTKDFEGARRVAREFGKTHTGHIDVNALNERIAAEESEEIRRDCERLVNERLEKKDYRGARRIIDDFSKKHGAKMDTSTLRDRVTTEENGRKPGRLIVIRKNASAVGDSVGAVWNAAFLGAAWYNIYLDGKKIGSLKQVEGRHTFSVSPGQYNIRIQHKDKDFLLFGTQKEAGSGSVTVRANEETTFEF